MKKTMAALVAGILLILLALAVGSAHVNRGSTHINNSASEVKKITHAWEYRGLLTVDVFTSDYTVKEYRIYFDRSDYYVFRDVLPKVGCDPIMEQQITEQDWNALVDALNENDFMGLPERLPGNDNTDSWNFIKVETVDGVHKTGSYGGDDEANMRFRAVDKKIDDILHPNAQYFVE